MNPANALTLKCKAGGHAIQRPTGLGTGHLACPACGAEHLVIGEVIREVIDGVICERPGFRLLLLAELDCTRAGGDRAHGGPLFGP